MDFLKVSDKTTTPCRSDSLFGLNQQQYKESSFGFRDMEIHPHPHVITPCNNLSSLFCSFDLILKTEIKAEHNEVVLMICNRCRKWSFGLLLLLLPFHKRAIERARETSDDLQVHDRIYSRPFRSPCLIIIILCFSL